MDIFGFLIFYFKIFLEMIEIIFIEFISDLFCIKNDKCLSLLRWEIWVIFFPNLSKTVVWHSDLTRKHDFKKSAFAKALKPEYVLYFV